MFLREKERYLKILLELYEKPAMVRAFQIFSRKGVLG